MNNLCHLFYLAILLACGVFFPVFGFAAISLYCAVAVFKIGKAPRLSYALHHASISIYCGVAASFQISSGTVFWGAFSPAETNISFVMIMVALYLIGFEFSGIFFKTKNNALNSSDFYVRIGNEVLVLAIAFFSYCALYLNYDLNFTPRGILVINDIRPFEFILFSVLPKTMLWVAVSLSGIVLRSNRKIGAWVVFILCLLLALHGASLTTSPRQIIIVGLLPLVVVYLLGRSLIIIFGLVWIGVVAIGPIINLFSRDQFHDVGTVYFPYSQDFDAVFIMSVLHEFVTNSKFELGFGRYILNAFSFFLPSEYKPFAEYDVLSIYGGDIFSQSNVSLPPFFTAYLDFGLFGVLLFGFLIGWLLQLNDRQFYTKNSHRILMASMIGASLVPFVRGPILGWGMFFLSGVICFLAYILLTKNSYFRS